MKIYEIWRARCFAVLHSASGSHLFFSSGRHLDSIVRSRKADEVNAATEAVYSEVAGLSPDTENFLKTSVENSVNQPKWSILSHQYSLRGGSDIVGRYSGKVLLQCPFEHFL